jgi:hypothetical protein
MRMSTESTSQWSSRISFPWNTKWNAYHSCSQKDSWGQS